MLFFKYHLPEWWNGRHERLKIFLASRPWVRVPPRAQIELLVRTEPRRKSGAARAGGKMPVAKRRIRDGTGTEKRADLLRTAWFVPIFDEGGNFGEIVG